MTTAAEKVVVDAASDAAPIEKIDKHADKRRALGRGLDSLLPSSLPREGRPGWAAPNAGTTAGGGAGVAGEAPAPHGGVIAEMQAQAARAATSEPVLQIALDQIDPNPYQTRVEFDQEMLTDLAESIKVNGVVQPVVVRPAKDGRYVLVLGERRCRASKMAGKTTIAAIVRRVSDQQAAEMTVVENLQRQDLNCMEQASAFAKLSKEFGLTQAQIGDRVGLSRESVANYMRLLRLPGKVMQYLMHGALDFSSARELLKLEDNETIGKVAELAVEKRWSYLQLQDMVENYTMKRDFASPSGPPKGARWVDPNVRAAQHELQRVLGLRVKISDRRGKGKIVIEYGSVEDYERVVGMLRGK
jgi:ParB family transcriptional regulator, chromosome partitioning protein